MQKKPLIETNPHLSARTGYRKALIANIASSTAIETGTSVEAVARLLTKSRKTITIKKTRRSPR